MISIVTSIATSITITTPFILTFYYLLVGWFVLICWWVHVTYKALHPVVLPLSIATYNFFVMLGIFPKLELDRRGLQHHLRYHDAKQQSIGGSAGTGDVDAGGSSNGSPDSGSSEDLITERRRAKAMKVRHSK